MDRVNLQRISEAKAKNKAEPKNGCLQEFIEKHVQVFLENICKNS